jgi:hypothetical protein
LARYLHADYSKELVQGKLLRASEVISTAWGLSWSEQDLVYHRDNVSTEHKA